MYCFQVTETVQVGLFIDRTDGPCVVTPHACTYALVLGRDVGAKVDTVPADVPLRLARADVRINDTAQTITFNKPRRHKEHLALVHIETAAGEGGKVFLTANAYDPVLRKGQVKRDYRAFPDAGIAALCSSSYLAKVNAGVDCLDLLVTMCPGASFRIFRNGSLDGATPQLFIHWTGSELRATFPQRYAERVAAGFLEGVSAEA